VKQTVPSPLESIHVRQKASGRFLLFVSSKYSFYLTVAHFRLNLLQQIPVKQIASPHSQKTFITVRRRKAAISGIAFE
jgi:hypothetical protein